MRFELVLYSLIMLGGTFISSIAQVMLKKAAMKNYSSHIVEYINPTTIVSYAIFFAATFMGIIAYKVVPLSMGPILESSSYIYVTIFGTVIFKEQLTKKKVIGLLIIICGIVIYTLG